MSRDDDLKANIGTNLVGKLELTSNLKQEVVMTTRDKIKVALHEMLPNYTSTEQLLAWVGLSVGLVLAVLTADFRDVVGVPGEVTAGAFGLAAVLTILWTLREVVRWWSRATLDDVAERIIRDASTQTQEHTD